MVATKNKPFKLLSNAPQNLLVFLCLLGTLIFLIGFDKPKPVKIGDRPPEFFLSDLTGNLRSLYQFKGKIVIVYFWNDSCHKDRSPLVDDSFYQKYKEKGLAILAINSGQPRKFVEAFVKNNKNVSYEILLDQRSTAFKQYGVVGLPMYFILDRQGIVRQRILGEISLENLEKLVVSLL